MDYRAIAIAIRDERRVIFREYAKAGYLPAWSKVLFWGLGMDMPFDRIEEFHRLDDVLEQELSNPYVQGR